MTAATTNRAGARPTILVVEDDAAVRNLILTTLDTEGYAHLSETTGRGAIASAATSAPDVVLLDLGLPDIDGIEVVRAIRAWSQMPIIVVSARTEDADKIRALDAGAEDMEADGPVFEVTTDPDSFNDVVKALEEKGYTFESAEIEMVPQNYITMTNEDDVRSMTKLLDMLDDNEDVQNVWHNWQQD